MSCKNPTHGPRSVPLILPDDQRKALREDCHSTLQGVLDDLATPDRLRDPAFTASEGQVFRRLLEALDSGEIRIPDREMRERVGHLSDSFDEIENAEEVIAGHEARHALLRILDGSVGEQKDGGEDEAPRSPGPGWLPGDEADCRREVLALLLAEAPDCLAFEELVVALAGHPPTWEERDTLEIATRSLVWEGLIRRQGEAFAPTRAARQMAALGFCIG